MKQAISPINNEIKLQEDEFIVSKTDTRGVITYVNRTFMRVSGFSEPEMLGQPHNVIRHPEMPRGVFRLLWKTLESKQEFVGYVKNLCKDGSYYWVLANITLDYNSDGKLQGYYSARRKPQARALKAVLPLYQEMLRIEASYGKKDGAEKSMAYLLEHCRQQGVPYDELVLALDR